MRMRRKPVVEWEPPYLPYFTALVLEHNWPPGWEPRDDWHSTQQHSARSTENRQRRVALGDTGSIAGLSTASADIVLRYRAQAAQEAMQAAVAAAKGPQR